MNEVTTIGLDLVKYVFQVHGVDQRKERGTAMAALHIAAKAPATITRPCADRRSRSASWQGSKRNFWRTQRTGLEPPEYRLSGYSLLPPGPAASLSSAEQALRGRLRRILD